MKIEDKLKKFMEIRQLEMKHPYNIFEYLQALSDFYQIVDIEEGNITEEQFNSNKKIVKLCFESVISIMKEFKITEDNGILLDYLNKCNTNEQKTILC